MILPQGIWDLSSPTRDRTCTSCIGKKTGGEVSSLYYDRHSTCSNKCVLHSFGMGTSSSPTYRQKLSTGVNTQLGHTVGRQCSWAVTWPASPCTRALEDVGDGHKAATWAGERNLSSSHASTANTQRKLSFPPILASPSLTQTQATIAGGQEDQITVQGVLKILKSSLLKFKGYL